MKDSHCNEEAIQIHKDVKTKKSIAALGNQLTDEPMDEPLKLLNSFNKNKLNGNLRCTAKQ